MPQAAPVIRTKLRPPFIRPGLVPRTRLQEQIAQGLCGPLTLVVAPAGFGKTTLVASGVAGSGMPVAWLSLDRNDNQPGRFLTYLVAALRSANPAIGNDAAQLVAGIQPSRPEAVLASLVNDLESASLEMVLVLDDYHVIDSPPVHEALTFFIDHLPDRLHLVIASRSDPPLPLARLRARGQMVELRTAELRFTEPEAAEFLNDVMGLHLEESAVGRLEARTEGWIAGLQMAALSMRGRSDTGRFIEGFSGTNRFILDYLLEEVLASQPLEIQAFLLHTAVLERLSAALCDYLLEEYPPSLSSSEILNILERENLFLVAFDEPGGAGAHWFRYHHLFADLLLSRLQQDQPDRIPHLHILASEWFEQNGFIAESVQHRLAAHQTGPAADLIEQYGPASWAANDPSIVQMAEGLPRDVLLERPRLALYLAWLLVCQAHIDRAIPLLAELGSRLPDTNSGEELGWVQTVIQCAQAFLSVQQNLPGEAAVFDVPDDEPILRDAAEVLYGMALVRHGELDRAAKVARESIQAARLRSQLVDEWAVPSMVPFLARVYLVMGRLQAVADLAHEYGGRAPARGVRSINSPGSLETALGEALYEWNDLDGAEMQIRRGLRANEPWENIMTEGFGCIALARVLLTRGDIPGARQVLEKLEARFLRSARPREFEEELRTLGPRLQLASGDLQGAAAWADEIIQSEDYQRFPGRYQATLARIRLAHGRFDEAEEWLSGEPDLERAPNRTARQIEHDLLRAAAIAGQGRLAEALEQVDHCLALAEPESYIRVFLNAGEPARDLVSAYLRAGPADHQAFARKVLDAFSPTARADTPAVQSAGLPEPLSARELEVLDLMAQGRTNPEIARTLVVAPGTIKAHAASIYRKLDAANRTEAVARARQLALLP